MIILRVLGRSALLLFMLLALLLAWLWPRYQYLPPVEPPFTVQRVGEGPLIHAALSERLAEVSGCGRYVNINGPSVIRVPDWIEHPLGRYYLFFAHHKGDHIRLAYADDMTGPWTVYEPGTLQLAGSGFDNPAAGAAADRDSFAQLWENFSLFVVRDMLLMAYRAGVTDPATREARGVSAATNSRPHIASPDVHVDHAGRQLVMYYDGLAGNIAQKTRVATSRDGIHFTPGSGLLHTNYLRAFTYRGQWYGLAMPGVLYRSADGLDKFEARSRLLFEPDMRHAGLWLRGDILYIFWSRVGDAPERLYVSQVDLSVPDWNDWMATEGLEVLRPELIWEGANLPLESSLRGELGLAANELRDPFVFEDEGRTWLFYTGAAEQAIGLARIITN